MKKSRFCLYHLLQPRHITLTVPFVYSYYRKKNPIMKVEMNGQMLRLPFNHMGPCYQMNYENYDRQIGKICRVIFNRIGRINVIDIGANIGDTIINIGLGGGGNIWPLKEKSSFSYY